MKLSRALRRNIIMASLALCFSPVLMTRAQPGPQPESASVQLREGVVINKNRNAIYLLNPQGKMEALSLDKGEVLWTSTDSIKPLALINGRLFALGRTPGRQNVMSIVQVDSLRGRTVNRKTITLPEYVKISFQNTGNASFQTLSRVIDGDVYIYWQYQSRPVMRGMPDSLEETSNQLVRTAGVVRINRTTGTLTQMDTSQAPRGLLYRSILADRNKRVANGQQQFLSADGNHVLASSRVADDSQFENYKWEIYNAATGNKIGELMDYRSYAPFIISGNTIIYDIGPYMRASPDGNRQVPLQIRAVDLTTKQELWRRQVLDPVYRGPLPS